MVLVLRHSIENRSNRLIYLGFTPFFIFSITIFTALLQSFYKLALEDKNTSFTEMQKCVPRWSVIFSPGPCFSNLVLPDSRLASQLVPGKRVNNVEKLARDHPTFKVRGVTIRTVSPCPRRDNVSCI